VICAAIEAERVFGHQTFNVGSNEMNMRIGTLATMVASEMPYAKVHQIPDGPDLRSYNLSFNKLTSWYSAPMKSVEQGIKEIHMALHDGKIDGSDPRGYTVQYYRSLLEWEKRLSDMRLDGRIL